ncbi:hypothetical protein PybrP1_000994 [[Pythium] brassicae (nom. inval.)]|nr:hypothetical protein PybrP1_000994 [[Pythium] brassicae (nom. inval.)]
MRGGGQDFVVGEDAVVAYVKVLDGSDSSQAGSPDASASTSQDEPPSPADRQLAVVTPKERTLAAEAQQSADTSNGETLRSTVDVGQERASDRESESTTDEVVFLGTTAPATTREQDSTSYHGGTSDVLGSSASVEVRSSAVQRALAEIFVNESDAGEPAPRAHSSPAASADDHDAPDAESDAVREAIGSRITPVLANDDVKRRGVGEVLDDSDLDCSGNEGMAGEIGVVEDDAPRGMRWAPSSSTFESRDIECPEMTRTAGRPTKATQKAATSPLSLFHLFFPKSLWVEIAADTNCYKLQQLDQRAQEVQTKLRKKHALDESVMRRVTTESLRGHKRRRVTQKMSEGMTGNAESVSK